MLDSETRRRIDNLRDILVGKLPGPESQVEQITTALIYKFMYDMDQESIELGGVPSFFVGDFEKYSWHHLFNPKLSGINRVKLYSEAIENMYTNPAAPSLFREIFKNSFLPFKDPSTLNMFLKEINEFHYSHSEKLGDAFEYLLSFMGSQGDAGQFRTPRHIIDFIVEIVDPKKNETILDPSCGTAGFLISSYKHILKQNTSKKLGDRLTAEERKKLGDNLVGYDISPDMTRISLVNMYLHQFVSPRIYEYDTLSSDDRWNEYYDVILANPPFFSPKGGITPHSRFGVQSTRAEVLFVDYIMEHLKPRGRAGIIVPEGIIFQTGRAYKTLRKKLVESSLVGVISLPTGVFQPYSGVKTSVLILDKWLNQKSDSIIFVKVENDGFSLGAQRNPVEKNDIPKIIGLVQDFCKGNIGRENPEVLVVQKDSIQNNGCSLQASFYSERKVFNFVFQLVQLTDYVNLKRGKSITKKAVIDGSIPVIAGGKNPAYFHNEANREGGAISISSSGANAGYVNFHSDPIFASDCITAISNSFKLDQKFLYYLLKSQQEQIYEMQSGGGQPHVYPRDFERYQIPLPPVAIQQEIVEELDGYQKIIDGCKQVVENYKPIIDIDSSWKISKLGKVISLEYGKSLKKKDRKGGKFPVFGSNGIVGFHDEFIVEGPCIIVGRKGSAGEVTFSEKNSFPIDTTFFVELKDKNVDLKFIFYSLRQLPLKTLNVQSAVPGLNRNDAYDLEIPIPSIEIQQEIVEELDRYQKIIDGCEQIAENYTKKIQDKMISKVWGENLQTNI